LSRGGSGGKSVGRESRPSKSGGEFLAHTARRRSLSLARPCQYGTNRHKPQLNRRRAILLKIISISRQFAFLRKCRYGFTSRSLWISRKLTRLESEFEQFDLPFVFSIVCCCKYFYEYPTAARCVSVSRGAFQPPLRTQHATRHTGKRVKRSVVSDIARTQCRRMFLQQFDVPAVVDQSPLTNHCSQISCIKLESAPLATSNR